MESAASPIDARTSGFTILELSAGIVIIAVLAILIIAGMATLRARAQRVQCAANLRSLHIAAALYVQENGSWPQIESSNADTGGEEYAIAWIDALKQFGPTRQTWICPTIQGLLENPDVSRPENARIDYIATSFDDKPGTPFRWPRQPWFAETGNVHRNGNLIIFADGSISDLNTVTGGADAQR